MNWQCKKFAELSVNELYDALKLRSDVFVVEQNCVYPDLDDKDKHDSAHHLLGYQNNQLLAYARLLPATVSYTNVSFGRVVTAPSIRNSGAGHMLIEQILLNCELLWPGMNIDIGAQVYLQKFYARYGFVNISSMYLEDGIEHVDMRLTK